MRHIDILGAGFIILGMLMLLAYGLYAAASANALYFLMSGAVLLIAGAVVLALSAAREKIREVKGIKTEG
jgi:hypothetical protein